MGETERKMNMDKSDIFDLVFMVVLAVVSFLCGIGYYHSIHVEAHRKEAVRNGYAEYILDPATGETTWQWKKKKGEVKP